MPRHVTAEQTSLAQLLSNDASPPFREREKCNVSLCLWWTGKVQRLKLASENVLCHYICAIYKQEPFWDSDASSFSLWSLSSISHPHRLKGAWKMLVGQTFTLPPSNNLFTFFLSFCLFLMFCLSFFYYAVSSKDGKMEL